MKKIVISLLMFLFVTIIVIFMTNVWATKAVATTLADMVISLSHGSSWNAGASGVYYTNSHEYRYVGISVNNYVKFNDDLYQIIGVFDDNSHGVTGQWLVKLIMARPIGGYSWGMTNAAPDYTTYLSLDNNWETGNANILLNEYFLNATDTSSIYGKCINWTYFGQYSEDRIYDCSRFLKYSIHSANIRNYIQPVTWYLKGYSTGTYSKQNFYECERSDTTTITNCNSGYKNSNTYATKVTNKSVGLMYLSDYLYASAYFSSSDTTNGTSYYYGQQNWLYNGNEWTITPIGDNVVGITNGGLYSWGCNVPNAIRPSFYLKANVMYESGNGSFDDPYVISCDACNS